ncbi:helix-turn-helix domain-containing protein [uncultured Kordia sp.]|uniref:helix-turn-helix domain-containing protein n=1 Tax=uncultured Kordia sp. TaxID=507699 RepID=UPI002634BE6E|nr:helix-turn-helix domain-containing protein [uncultured Kordia sp.]
MLRLLKKGIEFFVRFFKGEPQKAENTVLEIQQDVILDIMDRLSDFEHKKRFLKHTSLHLLAKKLQTNPKYLSKIINIHYEKNFSSYINDLRIKYLLKELQKDSLLKTYTVKKLAKELGFNNTEVFSKAFKKHTGVNPSNYLNSLKHS